MFGGLNGSEPLEGSAVNGTVISLQGLATLDPVVDTPVTVMGSWSREGSNETLNSTESTSPPLQHATPLTLDPLSVGGEYVFMVAVSSLMPNQHIEDATVNISYTLDLRPYPVLEISMTVSGGECVTNEAATLMGSVSLLPNTATDHTLTYTWRGPDSQAITANSGDLTVAGRTLTVANVRDNVGEYVLTACLNIPGTTVINHCSAATYLVSSDG